MSTRETSRRSFLMESANTLSAAWVAANYAHILAAEEFVLEAAQASSVKFQFFTPAQATEIEAMAAQIIPTDETPGAREARVINFIDRALSTFAKNAQPAYIKGLDDLQSQTKQLLPNATTFSGLTAPEQIKVLTAMEKTSFFNTVRTHTTIGFFASPVHGGNQGKIRWALIGYDDS